MNRSVVAVTAASSPGERLYLTASDPVGPLEVVGHSVAVALGSLLLARWHEPSC